MKIFIACLSQGLLWALDDVIGGLYSIDLETFETKCVIDGPKLFPHGKFPVLSLFVWKADYIVIVPLEADKNWIIYNKITGELTYRKVVEQKCREILVAADSEKNQLYFFPLYRYDPILTVELDTLTCSQRIENWDGKVPDGCLETAWKGACDGRYVFFPIKNTKILVRMDCGSKKVDLLELDIEESLIGVDYAFEELWLLPVSGNRLYQIDENGLIVNRVELSVEDDGNLMPAFARIVVQKRYLFLLPYYREGIYVYDKQEGKTQIIPKEIKSREKENKEVYLWYWEFCVRGNRICFLPYRDSYIEIDLDTLAYKKKELSYPDIWSDGEKAKKNIWSHVSEIDPIIRETDGCSMAVFVKYMRYETSADDFSVCEYVGNRTWDVMKN